MPRLVVAVAALLASTVCAYQADLVPAGRGAGSHDVTGQVSVGGADGSIHVTIDNVNDAHGAALDGTLALQLRVRVNGLRRRVTIPIALSAGSGDASDNLGLRAGDRVIVRDVRVRGPDHHTVAEAGVVATDASSQPPPSAPPASLAQCQAELTSCTADLDQCNADLDTCQSGG